MRDDWKKLLTKYLIDRRRHVRLTCVAAALSIVVVVTVFWQLSQPVITMTPDAVCGLNEHAHSEKCYVLQTACLLTDDERHEHGDECFNNELICQIDEHLHTDECYRDSIAEPTLAAAWVTAAVVVPESSVPAVYAVTENTPVPTEVVMEYAPPLPSESAVSGILSVEADAETAIPAASEIPVTSEMPFETAMPVTSETPAETAMPVESTMSLPPESMAAAGSSAALDLNNLTANQNSVTVGQSVVWSFNAVGAQQITYELADVSGLTTVSQELEPEATSVEWIADRVGEFMLTLTAYSGGDTLSLTSETLTVSEADEAAVECGMRSCFAGDSISFNLTYSGDADSTFHVSVAQGDIMLYESAEFADTVNVTAQECADVTEIKLTFEITNAGGTVSAAYALPCAVRQVETRADWENSIADAELTGEWPGDLAAVARTQLGYCESEKNFIVNDEGIRCGYTRYGDWAGMAYEEWCAMFASFCLEYANVPEGDVPRASGCERWTDALRARDLYAAADAYAPMPGDIIFFDYAGDGKSDHVGIVVEVSGDGLTAIEGNSDNAVRSNHYLLSDSAILGYGCVNCAYEHVRPAPDYVSLRAEIEMLADEPAPPSGDADESVRAAFDAARREYDNARASLRERVETAFAAGKLTEEQRAELEALICDAPVRRLEAVGTDYAVTAIADGMPANAQLTATEIMPGTEEYERYYRETLAAIGDAQVISFCRFFDVTFLLDGVEIEPDGPVDVSITYTERLPVNDAAVGKVVHFDVSNGAEEPEIHDAHIEPSDDGDSFVFTQDGFSVIATVMTMQAGSLEEGGRYVLYGPGGANDAYPALGADLYMAEAKMIAGAIVPQYDDMAAITWIYSGGALTDCNGNSFEVICGDSAGEADSVQLKSSSGKYVYYGNDIGEFVLRSNDATWLKYIRLIETDGVTLTLTDDIFYSGKLIPRISGADESATGTYMWEKWNGSSWKTVKRIRRTLSEYNIAADTSWLNVAVDKGAQATYRAELMTLNGAQLTNAVVSNEINVPYRAELINGSFETPAAGSGFRMSIPGGAQGVEWRTDGHVELISVRGDAYDGGRTHGSLAAANHGISAVPDGCQCAELNSGGAIYQDILTVPGSAMYWQVLHSAHLTSGDTTYSGNDTMYIIAIPSGLAEGINTSAEAEAVAANPGAYPGAAVWRRTAGGQWTVHSGKYAIPAGQYMTRWLLVPGSAASGDSGMGNHIDGIWFDADAPEQPPETATLIIEAVFKVNDGSFSGGELAALKSALDISYNGERVDFSNEAWVDGSISVVYSGISAGEYTVAEALEGIDIAGCDRTTSVAVDGGEVQPSESAEGISVNVDLAAGAVTTVTFTHAYTRKTGGIAFEKVDGGNMPLEGATFTLYADRDCAQTAGYSAASGDDGSVVFSGLSAGIYYMKETAAPEGCRPNAETYMAEVSAGNAKGAVYAADSSTGSGWSPYAIERIVNRRAEAEIIVKKVDDEGRALSGAKLQLKSMNADGTFTPCALLGSADNLSEWTLRLSGGTYRLTETEAPRGYYRTDDAIQFAVSEGIVSDVEISGSAVRYDGACITVINHVGVELPQTGGRGALPFMAAGLMMMAAALAGCGMRRGRERRAGK